MRFVIALVICCLAPSLLAHDGDHPPKKVLPAEHYKPTAMPSRIILTWSGDPMTTQSVTWRTDTTVGKAFAEIIEADSGPIDAKKATRVTANTTPFESSLFKTHAHNATFTSLKPATRYAYRVGDDVNWSEWFQFSTAQEGRAPFSFIYFGDAQNDVRAMWSRVIRESQRDMPKSAFFLHAGDLINTAEDDAQWGEWFEAGGFLNAMIPSIPTPGNHEYAKDNPEDKASKRHLSKNWRPQFTLPQNGPEGLEETCYFIDYQGTRIISLNSNEGPLSQVLWLDQVLSNNPNRWTICTFHHPIFSTAKDRDNPEVRAAWKPLLDKYKVDLVLTGHDHTYGRSGLEIPSNVATGLNIQSKESGTVYVVSVSGPKMYNLNQKNRDAFKRAAEDTQLYQLITVDENELKFEAKTAKGELYDAFTLKKREGEVNELIEQKPETPERLRPAETTEAK
jgi:3',5'-cyclic AMP phosphodiesterase CpdA